MSAVELATRHRPQSFWGKYIRNPLAVIGTVMLLIVVGMAVFAPWVAPYDPAKPARVTIFNIYAPPSAEHWLGTNDAAQDVLSALIYGARVSLTVGFAAGAISLVIGGTVGLVAGYLSGRIGGLLMRITEFILVIPDLALLIAIVAIVGQTLQNIVIVIGAVYWTRMARVVYAQTLTIRERKFVLRARLIGASDFHILRVHIFPLVLPLMLANTILLVSFSILVEAGLTFIGLGDPSQLSWGQMLNFAFARGAMSAGAWWAFLPPGLAIVWLVLSTTLIGLALEEIFNPRLKQHHLMGDRLMVLMNRLRTGIEPIAVEELITLPEEAASAQPSEGSV